MNKYHKWKERGHKGESITGDNERQGTVVNHFIALWSIKEREKIYLYTFSRLKVCFVKSFFDKEII